VRDRESAEAAGDKKVEIIKQVLEGELEVDRFITQDEGDGPDEAEQDEV